MSLTIAAGSASDDGLRSLLGRLEGRDRACAAFEQKKLLDVLSRPLVSHGRMVFLRGEGVLWEVTDPYPAIVMLRESNMTRWEDGKGQVLVYDRNPVFGALAGALVAVISGKFDALAESFKVHGEKTSKEDWRIVVTPRREALARLISGIEISGGETIGEINVREVGGDRTVITFSDVTYDRCKFTDAEKRFLAK